MYNIRKGWPCDGALDETLVPAAPKTITNGMLAAINTSGKLEKANLTAAAAATDPIIGIVIGVDKMSGKCTLLMSDCIIEMDSEHFATDTYTPNMSLTVKDGKFAKATTETVIGRVLSYDAVNQMLRVLKFSAGIMPAISAE